MDRVMDGMNDGESFQDDAVIDKDKFDEHLAAMRSFFERVRCWPHNELG
jgi:hypothetical protein